MSGTWAVIEVDEEGIPQGCYLYPEQNKATTEAIARIKEKGDEAVLRLIFAEVGYVRDCGWLIAVVNCGTVEQCQTS